MLGKLFPFAVAITVVADILRLFMTQSLLFAALAKAQQLLLDPNEREYILSQVNDARGVDLHDFCWFYNVDPYIALFSY